MRSLLSAAKVCVALAALALAFIHIRPLAAGAAEATTGLIVGIIVDAAGKPISGALVSAAAPSGRKVVVSDRFGHFTLLGLVPDTYVVSVDAPHYQAVSQPGTAVLAGQTTQLSFRLQTEIRTIGRVQAVSGAFTLGSTGDSFTISGVKARAQIPTTSSSGLANYTQGTVQGAIANAPGVDLDPFANAILRGGKVGDTVFDYASVPIPQGLIAEPGGNVVGAQLPTTGIASTTVTLAGYGSESDNALGGVINQIPAVGTYPGRTSLEIGDGIGTQYQVSSLEVLAATPDLKWRYALASTSGSAYFPYGDGHTFYPAEAGTYGLALQSRGQYSVEGNVHYAASSKDDVSILSLVGQAEYDQYGSPYAGQTIGAFNGTDAAGPVVYPGSTNPNAPVDYAAGVRGSYDVIKAEWLHTGTDLLSRVQVYESRSGSSSGGPFWDENGFPNGTISLSQQQNHRENGVNYDLDGVYGHHRVRFGGEYRVNTSSLDQIVPTAGEFITSHPTEDSYLAYLGDTWSASDRLTLTGTGRLTGAHFKPSDGFAYDVGALDPHFGAAYRLGSTYALRATFDHTTVAPAPLEVDRSDSANVDANGKPAPFVPLAVSSGNDFTYSFETTGTTKLRLTYYQIFEKNLIDVLPFNFRSAIASGTEPNGVGVPTNVGNLRANGLELWANRGGFTFNSNLVRAFSSSASQFAFNDLNAPAVAAGHLFPVGYQPDLSAELSYEFVTAHRHLRITPSLSYETGYPYGNGKEIYIFDPTTNKPIAVPNDNYYNPGYNYYFLRNPSLPFNALTNPYIGNLGTNEGADPNSLRTPPQMLVNLHVEKDLSPRLTAVLDVVNLFGNFSPTAYQGNPYLIGPPGYTGGNPLYGAAYQAAGGFAQPYTLGNGVPTNNGVTQSVPWTYGRGGYVPQSYPLGRSVQIRLRYSL